MNESWSIWLAKALGAIAGGGLSITFMLPLTARESAIRFFCGLFVGVTFGDAAANWFEHQLTVDVGSPAQRAIVGGFIASFVAWYALGFVTRFIQGARRPRDFKNDDDGVPNG